ncbi:MAG: hypothetical protein MR593_08025 [Intestinibacter sp.]|uniref:hypothetical protein n=1 Tax=Intestinibacter sp. TaxID=1965304 RepID=UPI0025BB7C2C|nr:hypothetical protein [Intestinibacter sp.]MCI6738049.1 hypothetical protein [Intestinibacter sp.]
MNEEQNKKLQEEKKNKQEIIKPEETGEIIDHKDEASKATEETVKEENPDAEVVEVSDEVVQDSEDAGEKQEESAEAPVEEKEEEKVEEPSEEEKDSSEEKEALEEENKEEEHKEEVVEEEDVKEEEEVDVEQLKKELAELKAEKEDEARERELVEVAQNVEVEYDRVVKGINEALRETLEQYQIPVDKSIQELEKEDPAKAQIARNLLVQAKQALDFNTQRLSNQYKSKEQDVIFTKAERLFNKYELSNEQAQVAAETFVSILQASGLQDLKDDLAAKVELSVAQARFKVPTVTPPVETVKEEPVKEAPKVEAEPATEPEKADENKPEEEASKSEEKAEEKAPEAPAEEFKLERGVAKEVVSRKAVNNLDDYKEGINGSSSVEASKASTVNKDNVLAKLAALPPRERQRFMKENFALVNAAMRDFNVKNSRRI